MAEGRAYGIRMTADGSGLVGATREATEAQAKLGEQLKKNADAARSNSQESRQFVDDLRKQADATGGATASAQALEAVQNRLPPALQGAARAAGIWGTGIAAAGLAVVEATLRSEAFERSVNRMEAALIAQGRATELSRAQLAALVRETALLPTMSQDGARQVIAAYTQMRGLGGAQIQALSRLTADFAMATGQTAVAATKQLGEAVADPTKGIAQLDRQYNVLSVSQLLSIQRFTEQGNAIGAQRVVIEALQARFGDLARNAMTPLEASVDRLVHAWPTLMDRMGNSSAIQTVAGGFAKIVDSASWLIENADRIALAAARMAPQTGIGLRMLGAAVGGGAAATGGAPANVHAAYGDQLWAQQDQVKQGLALATSYDTVGAERRSLTADAERIRASMEVTRQLQSGASGALERDLAETYERQAAGLAAVNERLAKLDETRTRMAAKGKTGDDVLMELAGLDKSFYQDLQLLNGEYGRGRLTLDQYTAAVGGLIEKQSFAKKLHQETADLMKRQVADAQLRIGQDEREGEVTAHLNQSWSERRQQIQLETDAIGTGEADREKLIAFRQIDLDAQKAMVSASPATIEAIYREADAEKARLGAIIDSKVARQKAQDAAEAASKAWQEEWKRTDENISRGLTDALMRGFESGKTFAQNFRDTLVNMFKTTILEPTMRMLVSPVAQGLTGLTMGLFGGNASAGGMGGLSNGLSLANMLSGGNSLTGQIGYGIQSALGLGGVASWGVAEEAAALGIGGMGEASAGFLGMGPAGWAIGAGLLAMSLMGDDSGPAQRGLLYSAGLGSTNRATDNYANYPWQTQWGSASMGPAQMAFQTQQAMQEQQLIARLKLTPAQIASVNAALATGPNQQWVNAGLEGTPVEQSGAFAQIQAARMQAISTALGRSIEELTSIMSSSADQWQSAIDQLEKAVAQQEHSLAQFVRGLPGQLGITSLEDFQRTLAIGDAAAPLDRLAAARGYYTDTLTAARGGDLQAIQAFTGRAQDYLSIGRDLYASGSGYQSIREEVTAATKGLLDQERALQIDILGDVPATLRETSQDQIAEIRRQTSELVAASIAIRDELRKLRGDQAS